MYVFGKQHMLKERTSVHVLNVKYKYLQVKCTRYTYEHTRPCGLHNSSSRSLSF